MSLAIYKTVLLFIILVSLLFQNKIYSQPVFSNLPVSTDSTYGYSSLQPLKLKKGNQRKCIENTNAFFAGLKTTDNQTLLLLFRSATKDPVYKTSATTITDKYTGLPLNGKPGILDKYIFITSTTKDTIKLYVDIYHKGTLFLPIGLKQD